MFKRVQKRMRKREREEELGLDGDMKDVLGLQDTDSDESDSSSEQEDSSDADSQNGADEDEEVDDGEFVELGREDGGPDVSDMDPDDDDDDDEGGIPEMSVTEAVKNPVYIVSLQPKVEACILCPGKLLKNQKMSEVHKASKAHNRRFSRFIELVGKAGPEADVRDLIREMNSSRNTSTQPTPTNDIPSKRALRRKEKLAVIKAKRISKKNAAKKARKRIEEKKKANPGMDAPDAGNGQPPKKKRKVVSNANSPLASTAADDGMEENAASLSKSRPTFTSAKTSSKAKGNNSPSHKGQKPEMGEKSVVK
ncbi:hypothetical protein BDY19DRAFT_905203 [Irpex rosettiformis]|uniref:Uncharacterized protein n=1 Tax=Irpex rosettiformis TaxID=378272 RepID=A0ACB8U775_9APHY|nr:hypothetical protein BDY19DRAFT_905203 [Irpex rosettiformis]